MTGGHGRGVIDRPAQAAACAMILICAAQFVLQLDFSIVNATLPTIQRDPPGESLLWRHDEIRCAAAQFLRV